MNTVLVLLVAVLATTIVSAGSALILYFLRPRDRRAALLPALVPLALAPPLVALSGASHLLIRAFGAVSMSGTTAAVGEVCLHANWLLMAGLVCCAAVLGLLALLGLAELVLGTDATAASPSSLRRQAALALLPLASLILCGAAYEYGRRSVDLAAIVVCADNELPEDQARAARYPILQASGLGAIAAVSERLAVGGNVGLFGSLHLLVVVLGFAVAAILIAWPASVSRALAAYTVVLVLTAAGCFAVMLWRVTSDTRWIAQRLNPALARADIPPGATPPAALPHRGPSWLSDG